jgi:anti-anti-sigma factor
MGLPDNIADIKEEKIGEVLVLRITGRLDALSSPVAEKKVLDLIHRGNIKLVLDLGGVTYLSSAGMRMLLSTTKKLNVVSGHFAVCSMRSNVLDLLKMSGFDHLLELFKTEEEALRHF